MKRIVVYLILVFLAFSGTGVLAQDQKAIDEKKGQLSACKDKIHPLELALLALNGEKEKALDELRSGYYCDKCNKSASEIERGGNTTFEAHLSDVNGKPIPASETIIKNKAAEYDRKIEAQKEKVNSQERSCQTIEEQILQMEVSKKQREKEAEEARLAQMRQKSDSTAKADDSRVSESSRTEPSKSQPTKDTTTVSSWSGVSYRQLMDEAVQTRYQQELWEAEREKARIVNEEYRRDVGERALERVEDEVSDARGYRPSRANEEEFGKTDFDRYASENQVKEVPGTAEAINFFRQVGDKVTSGFSTVTGYISKKVGTFKALWGNMTASSEEPADDLADVVIAVSAYSGLPAPIAGQVLETGKAVVETFSDNAAVASKVIDIQMDDGDFEEADKLATGAFKGTVLNVFASFPMTNTALTIHDLWVSTKEKAYKYSDQFINWFKSNGY